MWKNGTIRITELQNQDKTETYRRNKKNKEAREKFYAHVGIYEQDKIAAKNQQN